MHNVRCPFQLLHFERPAVGDNINKSFMGQFERASRIGRLDQPVSDGRSIRIDEQYPHHAAGSRLKLTFSFATDCSGSESMKERTFFLSLADAGAFTIIPRSIIQAASFCIKVTRSSLRISLYS